MGQASSDLSTEEVEDSSPSSLGIGESLRRRGILPNLNTSNRHDTNVEEPNEESLTEHRPDGRSTGNGRYNLRIRPSTTGENMSTSTNTTENESNSVETGNDVTTQNETEDGPRRRISTSNVIQISGRRQGSSILRLEGATLRSVLAVLTGRHDNDDDDSDDSDLPRGRSRRGLFDGMRMHSQDDNDDGSNTNSSATSDDEEWVRRIAGLSRGASFTRRHRTPAKNSRKTPQKVEPDILKALESSDFSASTRQSLGMSPYPERNDPLLLLTSSKQKLSGCVDNCRISIENEDSDGEIDIETVSPRCTSKNINSMGETSKQYSAKRSCPMSPHFLKQNNTENSSINECNRLPSISSWVSSRELGNFSRSAYASPFSHGRQCFLMGKFLPNKRRKIATFSQKLFCGTYSNCGNLFLSACQDQNIRLFDTSQSKFRHRRIIRARDVGWSVLDTALSPDNRHLIYSSWCDYIYQVNLYGSDGNLIKNDNIGGERNFSNEGSSTLEDNHQALNLAARDGGDRFCIFSMRFSQDGDEILCGAKDGYIYVYDRGSNQRSLRVNAHEDDVNAVAFIDSATHILASGGDDGICKIWDRRSLKETDPVPVGLLAGHVDGITYIDPRGDGRHLITNR
jgi:WD40 repeat protein